MGQSKAVMMTSGRRSPDPAAVADADGVHSGRSPGIDGESLTSSTEVSGGSRVAGRLAAGALELDPNVLEARLAGSRVDLSITEFRLLWYLLERAGRLIS